MSNAKKAAVKTMTARITELEKENLWLRQEFAALVANGAELHHGLTDRLDEAAVKADRHVNTIRALQKAYDRSRRYNKKLQLERDRSRTAMLEHGCDVIEYGLIVRGWGWVDFAVFTATGDVQCKYCGEVVEEAPEDEFGVLPSHECKVHDG